MKQAEKISNTFSDAYLLAMLEGNDTGKVLEQFSKDFPELTSQFEENAASLGVMYADIRTSAMPSENEISAAYKKVSERLSPSEPARNFVTSKPGLFARISGFFSASPTWAGASLGIGA